MPFLQFLNGAAANQLVELNPTATLTIGTSADAHIRITDPDVAPVHCQVYPAQGAFWLQDLGAGATFLNMQRLTGETDGLNDFDVFIIGRSFVRFVTQAPSGQAQATGSGMGADPSALQAQQREIASLKEEIDRMRDHGRRGEDLTSNLNDKLNDAKAKFEKVKRQITERDDEILKLRQDRGRNEATINSLEQDLASAKQDADAMRTDLDRRNEQVRELKAELEAKVKALKAELEGRDKELTSARREQETTRVDAKRLKMELGMLEKQSQKSLQSAQGEAAKRIKQLEATLERALASLAASRQALSAVGVQPPDESLPAAESTLAPALASLSPEQRSALEAALATHIDQEALRRFSGPPVIWERPPEAIRAEAEVGKLRSRALDVEIELSVADAGAGLG